MHLLYNKYTGAILGHFTCPIHLLDAHVQSLPGWQGAIEHAGGIDGATHYFDLINTIRPRPTIEAEPNQTVLLANSPDSIFISGLPIPCIIREGDQEYHMIDPDDRVFEFTTPLAGVYKITCEAWPHITKTWEVEAV